MAAPAWNPSDPTVYENPTSHDIYQVADATGDGQWHIYQTHAEYVWAAVPGQGFTDIVNVTPAQYAAEQAAAAAPPAPAPAPAPSAPTAPSDPANSPNAAQKIQGLEDMQSQLLQQVSTMGSLTNAKEAYLAGNNIVSDAHDLQSGIASAYQQGDISQAQAQQMQVQAISSSVAGLSQEIQTINNDGGNASLGAPSNGGAGTSGNLEQQGLEEQYTMVSKLAQAVNNEGGLSAEQWANAQSQLAQLQSQISAIPGSSDSGAGGTPAPSSPIGSSSGSTSSSGSSSSSSSGTTPNNNDGSTGSSSSTGSTTNTGDSSTPSQLGSTAPAASAAPTTSTDNTGSATPAAPVASGSTYTVVSGDTMWGIAQSNNIPLSQLEALNPQISNPELILPGQTINLGGGGVDTSTSTTDNPASGGGAYTVVHGDTLSGIAASSGIALSQLEAFNPQIKDPDLIFPGQNINLSGGSGNVSGAFGSQSSQAAGLNNADSGINGGSSASGGSGAIGFPEKSSYGGMGSEVEKSGDMTLGEKAEAAGWVDGSGTSDIAKGIFEVDNHTSTDPLKIGDKK